MKTDLYADLSWLQPHPADFNQRCRWVLESGQDFGRQVWQLAQHSLDDNQLIRLARTMAIARQKERSFPPLKPVRIGVASNGTTEFICAAITATGARYGLAIECVATGYDQALQDSLSADSALNRLEPYAVVIALDWRCLPLRPTPGKPSAAESGVSAALEYLDTVRAAIHRNSGAICIVQNLSPPPEEVFGSLDRKLEGTLRWLLDAVNARLVERLRGSSDILFDIARLAETVGLSNWHSPAEWNLAKLPFSQQYLPLYADHVCRLIAAQLGLSRRCLIVDLDNTLWGGVIGDDGLHGIAVGQGDPTGEAYLVLQKYLAALHERGVVLAVSSKNEDLIARLPFREHPDMHLREEHFAVFKANWDDKATNIRSIAETLSLGLESMVFLDDNPFERSFVRAALPQVAVPELPEDPALYARTLSAAGYFEAVTFSEEDRQRTSFYAGNAKRTELQCESTDLAQYLASLHMEIEFRPFNAAGRARITQLINKSNQFNLTTRRYTEADVALFEADPTFITLQVRLRDKLGDNGMISVVICRTETDVWEIDTWLMSCRVLGRGVENAVLRELLDQARAHGALRIRGIYVPTSRNQLVEKHYAKLGFQQVDQLDDGATVWELDVATATVEAPPMVVRSSGFESVVSEAA